MNAVKDEPQHDPENQNLKAFSEKILNSPMFVVFRADDKGSHVHFTSKDALILVAGYFSDPQNREDLETLKYAIFQRTKFQL